MVIRNFKRVETALLHLLLWLGKKFGREVQQGQLLDIRLTHQDLAELLGTTRVTITRILLDILPMSTQNIAKARFDKPEDSSLIPIVEKIL
jgi:hypothetical protein